MSYFKISEFVVEGESVPLSIADKILEFHINPILPVRKRLGFPIWASLRSGYRSAYYETLHDRSGRSEHCFRGKGAVDWTCRRDRLTLLLKELQKLPYTRICYYPSKKFIHCDYKESSHRLFLAEDGNTWTRVDNYSGV